MSDSCIRFAEVAWNAHDIQSLRPEWDIERCEAFLASIEHRITDRMIEIGWAVIEGCLPPEASA